MTSFLRKIWHKLFCSSHLVIKHDERRMYLECPECGYQTTGWDIVEELSLIGE